MHSLLKLRRLSASERWLLLRAWLLLPLLGAATRLLGLRRTQAALRTLVRRRRASVRDEHAMPQATAVARIVRIAASRGPYHAACLPQALALWWLLRRRGIIAGCRIGVRKDEGQLLAHAWVEYQGSVLGDDGNLSRAFTPIAGTDKALTGRTA